MKGLAREAMAGDLGVDPRPPPAGPLVVLENEDRRPLADVHPRA